MSLGVERGRTSLSVLVVCECVEGIRCDSCLYVPGCL